jgi:high-affinity iron transporter
MKQKFTFAVIFFPLIIAIGFLILQARPQGAEVDFDANTTAHVTGVSAEKLIFLLQYIGADYGGAVENGRVINEFEYAEMLDFAATSVQWYSQICPPESETPSGKKLDELKALVDNQAEWDEVKRIASVLIHDLSLELNVIPYPTKTPDLPTGKTFYSQACVDCHGASGDGRGPAAVWHDPAPSNLRDSERMNDVSPYQLYNAITFGVAGTSMPSHQLAFSDQERWDLAFYLMVLREDFDPNPPAEAINVSINELAGVSNNDLAAHIRTQHPNMSETDVKRAVDHLRQNPPGISPQEQIAFTEQKLHESFAAYEAGNREGALRATMEAYLSGIEPIEPLLQQKRGSLVTAIEKDFSKLRYSMRAAHPVSDVANHYENLRRSLEETRLELQSSTAQSGFVLMQSMTIILREGIEAILLIALMITYLVSAGYENLKKYVVSGALAGLAAGGLTWLASKYLLTVSVFGQEAMEGLASLLAAAVLFSVSFWIIHKVDIQKWKSFIRAKAEKAMGTGSGIALSVAAFLAVFREAFETVLFYHVLWLRNSTDQTSIILGFAAGTVTLAILLYVFFKVGARLPLKPFFAVSGMLLGLLAFVFAGYGVRELQNIGLLNETLLTWNIRWNLLEIHPTVEGLILQLGILTSFLLGWFSILAEKFKVEREFQLHSVAVEAE